ncbi:MAG: hypothetical protein EU547_06040 [Promethearchaeota archaeon]|nr:MAG: hypothetical protein EU547_06040 [Candidatus Lokiarchaeota archaeon]
MRKLSIVEKLWIFSDNGVPLADFNKEEDTDHALITSLMSAIHSFTENISGKNLKSFQTGKSKYTCVKCLQENIIIVIQSSKNSKEKNVKKTCEVIQEIFEKMYSVKQIEGWDGDLSFFEEFRKKIDLYFKLRDL